MERLTRTIGPYENAPRCLAIAGCTGVLAWFFLMLFGDWGFFSAFFMGLFIALVLLVLLLHFIGGAPAGHSLMAFFDDGDASAPTERRLDTMSSADAPSAPPAAAPGTDATGPAVGVDGAASASAPVPDVSDATVGEAASWGTAADASSERPAVEPIETAAERREEGELNDAQLTRPTAAPAPVPPVAAVTAGDPAGGAPEPVAAASGMPAASESAETAAPVAPVAPVGDGATSVELGAGATSDDMEGDKPETLDAPRGGAADDLKMIKGVGPKLERLLNEMGYFHFDQIARWTDSEVAWVDANLKGFKGRVTRDAWVSQARLLSEGGQTEFSQKVQKGNVYE